MKKFFAAALMLCFLCGCGAQSATKSTATSDADSSEIPTSVDLINDDRHPQGNGSDDGAVMGVITAVSEESITMQLMAGRQGQRGGGGTQKDGQTPPEDGNIPANGEAPSGVPEDALEGTPGTDGAEAPEAGVPGGNGEAAPSGQPEPGGNRDGGGEEIIILISDNTSVLVMSDGSEMEGSLADIVVGTMVSIEYADDGETAASITVQENMSEPSE